MKDKRKESKEERKKKSYSAGSFEFLEFSDNGRTSLAYILANDRWEVVGDIALAISTSSLLLEFARLPRKRYG